MSFSSRESWRLTWHAADGAWCHREAPRLMPNGDMAD
jgi:hypothetical protein